MQFVKILIIITCILSLSACNWIKDTAKNTINKSGEVIAKTGSEFGDGFYKGVKKTFRNEIKLSEELKKEGISFGEVTVNSTDSTSNNVLTAYIIFSKDFDKIITVKVFNSNGKEFGRVTQKVKGKANSTKYIDFIFDQRAQIGVNGKVTVE